RARARAAARGRPRSSRRPAAEPRSRQHSGVRVAERLEALLEARHLRPRRSEVPIRVLAPRAAARGVGLAGEAEPEAGRRADRADDPGPIDRAVDGEGVLVIAEPPQGVARPQTGLEQAEMVAARRPVVARLEPEREALGQEARIVDDTGLLDRACEGEHESGALLPETARVERFP